MFKPVRSILFATDLTPNCQKALDFTIAMASQNNAMVFMLHIIEHLPQNIEKELKELLGRHKWNDLAMAQTNFVRKSLLGKKATNIKVREQLKEFCAMSETDSINGDFQSKEIIISDGEVVTEILTTAQENHCDLIVLGAKDTFTGGNSVGTTIKGVLTGAFVPVSVVPVLQAEE